MHIVNRHDIIQWDERNWARALPFWAPHIQQVADPNRPILTLGERFGGLSLWLATNGYTNYCTDFHHTGERAKQLHQRYGVDHLVTYQKADVLHLDFPDNHFDAVLVKSLIGGIKTAGNPFTPPSWEIQQQAVNEIYRVLKPGGIYLGAENMKGGALHQIIRKLTKRNDWHYYTPNELDDLLQPFKQRQYQFFGYLGSRSPWKSLNAITGFIDGWYSRIMPKSARYIGFFVAKK